MSLAWALGGAVAWMGGAYAAGRMARAAGASARRWFWISAVAGPVGWVGAFVVARDARERGSTGGRRTEPDRPADDEAGSVPTSRTVRLPRSSAPFLEGKSHGGV